LKIPVFSTVATFIIELTIVLLVLFHGYSDKDSLMVVSVVIAVYGSLRAQLLAEAAVSAMYFSALSELMRSDSSRESESAKAEDLFLTARRELPFMYAGTVFHMVIAGIAIVRLLAAVLT
jgi:hypothetical protein